MVLPRTPEHLAPLFLPLDSTIHYGIDPLEKLLALSFLSVIMCLHAESGEESRGP